MSTVQVQMPAKLLPVFDGEADTRVAYGGRGSGKTRTFAKMTAVRALMWSQAGREGIILCGRQFMNSLEDSSLEEIKAAIRETDWLLPYFDIGEKYIRTKDGRIHYSFAGLQRNIDSLKSKARILLGWIDEAETVIEEAWIKLIPTLRDEESELWVTYNPERDDSATHKRFRLTKNPRTKVVEINWRDNPWFPEKLNRDRLADKEERPHLYDHIWEGDFIRVVEGAYFAPNLTKAREEGRIGFVREDPNLIVRLFADIGGTGAKADNFVFWAAQFVGTEIRWTNHYEQQGQPVSAHLNWMRSQGYSPDRCKIWLPHDGDTQDKVFDTSYRKALEAAGYSVEIVPNQGKGAAMQRVEKARQLFTRMRFDEEKCAAGLKAIGWYHEKRDTERGIGLGPNHDWSSHSCFTADTIVLTRYGKRRIDNLPATGEVMTPCGWKPYHSPRQTLVNAPLVAVVFDNGYSVRCTPDHMFLTESGWKSAESLVTGSLIRSPLTRSRHISTAAYTVCGQARNIYRAAASGFTETFGKMRSALFPRVATFTTGTETNSTTGSKTSNAWMRESIYRFLGMSMARTAPSISLPMPATVLLSGTGPRKAGFGISVMLSKRSHGQSGNASQKIALSAASRLTRWCAKVVTRKSTVPQFAKSLRIASVVPLVEREDVWDITVDDGHWFTLENGAVVHNSDAFGTGCVAYEEPRKAKKIDYATMRRGVV